MDLFSKIWLLWLQIKLYCCSKDMFDIIFCFYFTIHAEIKPKWMEHIRDGLLRNVDCNVVLVDWYRGSFPPYIQAAGNTRLVGAMIAEQIKFLVSQTQSSPDLYHVVGFSLGSHIAGYTGSRLNQDGLILGRITGNWHSLERFWVE